MSVKPRQERAVRTRDHILRATTECLVDHGHTGTTMQRVQSHTGVSRGTLTYHFGSIHSLLAASIHFIAEQQLGEIRQAIEESGPPIDAQATVRLLHPFMSGQLFTAGLELWTAARTSSDLRAELLPAERKVGRELRRALSPGVPREDLDVLLALFRGLAVTSILRPEPDAAAVALHRWAEQVDWVRNEVYERRPHSH